MVDHFAGKFRRPRLEATPSENAGFLSSVHETLSNPDHAHHVAIGKLPKHLVFHEAGRVVSENIPADVPREYCDAVELTFDTELIARNLTIGLEAGGIRSKQGIEEQQRRQLAATYGRRVMPSSEFERRKIQDILVEHFGKGAKPTPDGFLRVNVSSSLRTTKDQKFYYLSLGDLSRPHTRGQLIATKYIPLNKLTDFLKTSHSTARQYRLALYLSRLPANERPFAIHYAESLAEAKLAKASGQAAKTPDATGVQLRTTEKINAFLDNPQEQLAYTTPSR